MSVTAAEITEMLGDGTQTLSDPRTAALLEARRRHVALVGLQRTMRSRVLEENARADHEGRRGSKPRQRAFRQLQKEYEKLVRVRMRREEAEEREQRKRKQAWMNALAEHTDRFRRYHRDVVRRGQRAVLKNMSKYHDEMSRNATRAERDAERARIQKLKDDDEEGYLELVRATKNTRLLELLNQTDTYLKELGAIVKEERAKTGEVEYEGEGEAKGPAKHVYYDIAHAIKEEITEQSSLMVGGQLKEYQLQGVQWMVSLYNNRLNGILADEMGLGKTIQTLGLITYLMEMKENAGPYLVIVPLSTMSNWEMEFARWAPAVRVIVFKGDSKTRRRIYETVIEKNKFNVCLATYEYVVRGKNWLKRVHWQHIIIDEGHRIKNHESKLSIVLHNHYTSRSRLLLTGTPLQNSLTELWALLNFLLPKVFKSAESFESWFAAPFAQMGVGHVAATEESALLTEEESLLIIRRLHQVLRPFLLRRLKADVLRMGEQLPDKKEHIVICDMSAWQRSMYVKIVKSERVLFTDRHGRQRFDKLSNPAMQLRKCVNHPYLFHQDHSSMVVDSPDLWRCAGKFDMLDACLTKFLRAGHRMLVFNQMTKVVDLQARMLNFRKIPFYRLDGSTPPDERKQMVSDFNSAHADVHVFLLTTRAGGLGVNLQTADTVIIFDSDWNPSMDQQAQDRAHRIGQQREVLILRMITAKSVEEDVIERASFKRGLEEKIIRAGMFDESSKDSERQAMLRELLRVEEAASDGEDGEEADAGGMPTDEEINRLVARTEDEFELFSAVDRERSVERSHRPRLFAEDEIPEFAFKVPKNLLAKAEAAAKGGGGLGEGGEAMDLSVKPRRRSVTKNVSYGLDSLSERQYIKLMDDAGEGKFSSISDGVRSVQRRKRGRGRPPRGEEGEDEDDEDEEEGEEEGEEEDEEVDEEEDDEDEGVAEEAKESEIQDLPLQMELGTAAKSTRRRFAPITADTDSSDDSDDDTAAPSKREREPVAVDESILRTKIPRLSSSARDSPTDDSDLGMEDGELPEVAEPGRIVEEEDLNVADEEVAMEEEPGDESEAPNVASEELGEILELQGDGSDGEIVEDDEAGRVDP
jgi:ATP-dependent helicase STH1/SNF2